MCTPPGATSVISVSLSVVSLTFAVTQSQAVAIRPLLFVWPKSFMKVTLSLL